MVRRTPRTPSTSTRRGLRADALRNRDHLLAASRDIFVEQGPDAPLDDIARRAGVGIATLYRRFPDRAALIRAVVLDVLAGVGEQAQRIVDEEPDAFQALRRYMHHALDARIAAIFPALLDRLPLEDPDVLEARTRASQPVARMIERAQSEGALRTDVAFGDIGLLLVRLSRPLPGPFPRELDNQLAHRHLDLVLAGLQACAHSTQPPLGGPALELSELQTIGAQSSLRRPRRPPSSTA